MKITREEVLHIAELSRLSFDEDQLSEMGGHLERVLGQMKALDLVDTSKVSPTAHILPTVNVLRDDAAGEAFDREALLKNAPESDDGAYIVPQVLE